MFIADCLLLIQNMCCTINTIKTIVTGFQNNLQNWNSFLTFLWPNPTIAGFYDFHLVNAIQFCAAEAYV